MATVSSLQSFSVKVIFTDLYVAAGMIILVMGDLQGRYLLFFYFDRLTNNLSSNYNILPNHILIDSLFFH